MFRKSFVYHFKSTASSLPNNIYAINFADVLTCGIVYRNSINLFVGSELANLSYRQILCDNESGPSTNNMIISMSILLLNTKPVLAVLKQESFFIYEVNGSAIIYSLESKTIDPDNVFCCFSAIGESLILIGTDSGLFLKFEIVKPDCLLFKGCMRAHDSGLICMSSDSKWLASTDENSNVQFWKLTSESSLDLISKYSQTNTDYTCPSSFILMLSEKRVCATGYNNGRLCLFNCETGRLLAEISAHSRIITGLAFKDDILISISEDTICRVWRIGSSTDMSGDNKPSASVTLIQSIIVADQMLQGVAFTNRKGLEFVISSYDSNEVLSFVQA